MQSANCENSITCHCWFFFLNVPLLFRLPWLHQWVFPYLHGLLPGCGKFSLLIAGHYQLDTIMNMDHTSNYTVNVTTHDYPVVSTSNSTSTHYSWVDAYNYTPIKFFRHREGHIITTQRAFVYRRICPNEMYLSCYDQYFLYEQHIIWLRVTWKSSLVVMNPLSDENYPPILTYCISPKWSTLASLSALFWFTALLSALMNLIQHIIK